MPARFPKVSSKGDISARYAGPGRPEPYGLCHRCYSRVSPKRYSGLCYNCIVELKGPAVQPLPDEKEYQDVAGLDRQISFLYGGPTYQRWVLELEIDELRGGLATPCENPAPLAAMDFMPPEHRVRRATEALLDSLLA